MIPPAHPDSALASSRPLIRCHSSESADSYDVELAARINDYLRGAEAGADHSKTFSPVFREACLWLAGAAAIAVAAIWWLT
jgi:hypothetical protein